MQRDQLLSTAGETIAYAEDYIETRIQIAKLTVAEKGSTGAASAIAFAAVGILGLFALAALSIAAGLAIGAALDSLALGFVIVGVFYILLAVLLFALRKQLLIQPALRVLISSLFNPGPDGK